MSFGLDSAFLLTELIIKDLKMYNDALALVGLFYVGKVALKLTWTTFCGLKAHAISKLRSQFDLKNSFGDWAVVTGCTEGIGRAYALELAQRGLNLVLISRNPDKLTQFSQVIETQYSVKTKVIPADFSHGPTVYSKIRESLETLDIGILVNNVGVISPRPMYVSEMSEESVWDHINVNVAAVTIMTRMVLPQMLNKNKGAIVNMSSIASVVPVPLLSVYAATKAYVTHFCEALRYELKDTNIEVQTLIPSYINTQMVSYSPDLMSSYMVPSPDTYVKHALPTLGYSSRTTGYWLHGIQAWLLSWLPTPVLITMATYVNKRFRKEALASLGQKRN